MFTGLAEAFLILHKRFSFRSPIYPAVPVAQDKHLQESLPRALAVRWYQLQAALFSYHASTAADHYPNFLSSVMAGIDGHGGNSPGEFDYPFMPGTSMPVNVVPSGYQNLGYIQDYAEAINSSRLKPSNYRRKSTGGNASGTEQTKHRRTRSGCFMCRSRRVKVTLLFNIRFNILFMHTNFIQSVTKRNRYANVCALSGNFN